MNAVRLAQFLNIISDRGYSAYINAHKFIGNDFLSRDQHLQSGLRTTKKSGTIIFDLETIDFYIIIRRNWVNHQNHLYFGRDFLIAWESFFSKSLWTFSWGYQLSVQNPYPNSQQFDDKTILLCITQDSAPFHLYLESTVVKINHLKTIIWS